METVTKIAKGRLGRVGAYLLFASAGMLFTLSNKGFPSNHSIWLTLSIFLLVGGTLSAYGQYKRVWPPEYVGLPLVWTSLGSFTTIQVITISQANGIYIWLSLGNVALLSAITLAIFGRWLDVSAVYRAAKEHSDAQR
jgi:hypothetical protein